MDSKAFRDAFDKTFGDAEPEERVEPETVTYQTKDDGTEQYSPEAEYGFLS